ncbi:MAG TPA: hypothetical protein VLD63_02980 [Anaerolineales bacterium]|nr:hypothetical protein [Anaerolineales bacterium]
MRPGGVLLRAEARLAHELLAGRPHEQGKIVLAVDERCDNQEEPYGPST